MDTFVVTWRELLILVVLVLTVYVAEMLLLMRAGGALRKPRWLSIIEEKTYEAELRQQIEELQARLTALEVNSVPLRAAPVPPAPYPEAKKTESPPPVVKPAGDKVEPPAAGQQNLTAFQRAVRMAANGASAGELVGKCGISQSEADMIVALHKP